MSDTATKSRDLIASKFREPGKFKVILLNDDVTPMDFVVALLMGIFRHNEESAKSITLKIHNEGYGVAGTYTFEIAEQKATDATLVARNNNYPLAIKVEEE